MAKVLLFVIEDRVGPGIRSLASYLAERGHQPRLVFIGKAALKATDFIPENLEISPDYKNTFLGFNLFNFLQGEDEIPVLPESFLEFCRRDAPDILGFSTRFLEKRFAGFFSALRKAVPQTLLIAGGHGPSVYTEAFLDMDVDCVVRGEGEEALLDIANAVDAGKPFHDIPNVAYKDSKGRVTKNRMREPLDVKLLPASYRDDNNIFHVDGDVVSKGFWTDYSPYNDSILAGRGCIGSCSYCAASMWRDIYISQGSIAPKHRRRTNEQLIAESLKLKQNGAHGIFFVDDYFIRPYDEMVDFFNQWQKKIQLPFYIHLSLEQMKHHPDIFQRAIDSGLSACLLAQQTADERFALEIFHRKNDNAAILHFFEQAFDQYVPIQASFIDGYLIKGRDDLEAKLAFIRQMPFDPAFARGALISVMQLRIHPGSPLSHTWPTYASSFLPFKEFIYRAMLLHFRLIMDDDEFARLRANADYKKNPNPMLADFHALLRKKQAEYLRDSSRRRRGQEVYFFGCKQNYQRNKNLFSGCSPRAILVDQPTDELIVDGLEVVQLREALAAPERLPIVIFSSYAQNIARKIKKLRPDYQREEIIACECSPFD